MKTSAIFRMSGKITFEKNNLINLILRYYLYENEIGYYFKTIHDLILIFIFWGHL